MAAKATTRRAAKKAKAPKRAAKRRATRRAARKARRAAKPKAPKATRVAKKAKAPKRKATKAKKAKRVTKAMQTGSYRKVWNGTSKFTKGGLTKSDLCLNNKGKVISKKRFAAAKKNKGLKNGWWMAALKKARKQLGITGFVKLNRGVQGIKLYKLA